MTNATTPLDPVCGQKLSVWNDGERTFSPCFETLTFVLVPFFLLAVTSSFYIGYLRPPDVNLRVPSLFNVRKVCTGATLLITLGLLIKDAILIKSHLAPISFISYGIRILSLFLHFIFLWRLGLIHFDFKRGPFPVITTWLFTLAYFGVHLQHMIMKLLKEHQKKTTADDINAVVNLICAACLVACQLVYLGTLFQKNPRYRTISIISDDDSSELLRSHDDLLESEQYSNVGLSDVPAISEGCPSDSASLLSSLFFYWVQPLMRKGAKRYLSKAESVYHLPTDLKTQTICNGFVSTIGNVNKEHHSLNYSSQTLLKALHKRFGRWYYTLGILKFLADALAFAGPILLNKLVSFVNSKEALSSGYCYAAGLFVSTLTGALLATHFDYQVS